jgi:hypothetical protein
LQIHLTYKICQQKNRLGDIEVAYKMLGKGDPILLISGASAGIDYSKLRHVKTLTEGL